MTVLVDELNKQGLGWYLYYGNTTKKEYYILNRDILIQSISGLA